MVIPHTEIFQSASRRHPTASLKQGQGQERRRRKSGKEKENKEAGRRRGGDAVEGREGGGENVAFRPTSDGLGPYAQCEGGSASGD